MYLITKNVRNNAENLYKCVFEYSLGIRILANQVFVSALIKITLGLHRDYTRLSQGLHIFVIQ